MGRGGSPQSGEGHFIELPAPDGDEFDELAREARAILEIAARRGRLDGDRARRFARACVDSLEVGRLGLAILDGGPLVGRRLVELALAIQRFDARVRDTSEHLR